MKVKDKYYFVIKVLHNMLVQSPLKRHGFAVLFSVSKPGLVYGLLCDYKMSFVVDRYLQVGLLGHMMCLKLYMKQSKYFPK